MLSQIAPKKFILMLIIAVALKGSMSLPINSSLSMNENETYYEFQNDLTEGSVFSINLTGIIIDGKSHNFIGAFNISSGNITFQNIRFSSYNNFISAYNSNVNIINCTFMQSQNAIILHDSNFSLSGNSFEGIGNAIAISANSFFANVSGNRIGRVANLTAITSPLAITGKIMLNSEESDFYGLFKSLGNESNHYFNAKHFFIHNGEAYDVADNSNEFYGLIAKKSKNIAFGSNITAIKTLLLTNDINIYANSNYFISNINRDYSIVLIGDIDFKMESVNFISNSGIALSNMGANAKISNSSFFAKSIGYYQLEGNSTIQDTGFYFSNESEEATGMHIDSGQANISNAFFINAKTGLIALSDSAINGIAPKCINHSSYNLMFANLESAFGKNSVILPKKSMIYSKEYDYYSGITVNNPQQNELCSYPGFLLNGKYPWETEYEQILANIKNLMGFKSQNPLSALGDLNFVSSYENYSAKYDSKNPELIGKNGEVFNPFLTQKIASIEINISKDDLWIVYPLNAVILPILPINASRVISSGHFESNELIITNDFETDSNNSIIIGKANESVRVSAPKEGMSLVLKKGGETIFNSALNNHSEIFINLSDESGVIPKIIGQYDFYWIANGTVSYIERLSIKITNNVLLKSGNNLQEYYENVRRIIFDYYSDYEKGIIDFSKSVFGNTLTLKDELTIERNIGNKVSITIPLQVYSISDWDGYFLMPTLLRDYSFENKTAAFAFKVGNENIDLYSSKNFTIIISGFCGFSIGFENQTGAYAMPKSDYFCAGNDLVIKTNHLSTFFVYKEMIEQSQEANIQNNMLILENLSIPQSSVSNFKPITGLTTLFSISQKDFLGIFRAIFCILIIFAILLEIKKNYFH
jgi:hypothetical protein